MTSAERLPERVAEIISRYNMLSDGDRCGVAVSGGIDSVVLLHLLTRLSIPLVVLHLNHQLRCEESLADERFVRDLSESLGVPVEVRRVTLPEDGNLEENARLARRAFFLESMKRLELTRVALGHTRSDQAETVLFRLLRGSGLAGLAGMRRTTPEGFIRPLLTTSRAEIRQWAEANGIRWREDSSNQNLQFRRNRLRYETIPALETHFNPNLQVVLAGMAEVAQAEEEFWAERIEPIYHQIAKRTLWEGQLALFLQIPELRRLHVAEQRRIIRRTIQDLRGDLRSIDLHHIDEILGICQSVHGHDRVIIPGVDALRSYETLRLMRPEDASGQERHYQIPIRMGQWHVLPFHAGKICVNWADDDPQNCVNFKKAEGPALETAELDGGKLFFSETEPYFYIRNWQSGDKLQASGQTEAQKLKFLFGEHRILLWERKHWPVLVYQDEVVWTRKFGCSAKFQGSAGSGRVLQILYDPDWNG